MKGYCITFRSITYAQNGQRALQQAGVSARLTRTPKWMEERGCGYCLQVPTKQGAMAVDALRAAGTGFRAVYVLQADGSAAEVVL